MSNIIDFKTWLKEQVRDKLIVPRRKKSHQWLNTELNKKERELKKLAANRDWLNKPLEKKVREKKKKDNELKAAKKQWPYDPNWEESKDENN